MSQNRTPSLALSMLLAAMAGGMGWGIRGQYGHETGAMLAGLLVGLLLVMIYGRSASSLAGARAAALLTLGISLGGSMTYGQTLGLTQNSALIGNYHALGWGLFGTFLKGGIWIGLGGAFLGVGLGGKRYRAIDLSLLLISMCFLWFLGVYLLNQPYDPGQRLLPRIYFSEDWRWQPDGELAPRREVWGGLLLALVGMVLYARVAKQDRLVLRLACWGFLGGGLGFALGQSIQAGHAWNSEWFRTTPYVQVLEPHINWWNMMEITFGAVWGGVLALGVWLNQEFIDLQGLDAPAELSAVELSVPAEWITAVIHVAAVLAWTFISFPAYDLFADQAITMILIPTLAVLAGRWWPYLVTLPMVLLPIAGKTVQDVVYEGQQVSPPIGWLAYFVVPLLVSVMTAWFLYQRHDRQTAGRFAALALWINSWTYFALNLAFFRYPWPWQAWTTRTPSALIFFVCTLGLTVAAAAYSWTSRRYEPVGDAG